MFTPPFIFLSSTHHFPSPDLLLLSHLPSEPYWFLRLWQVKAACCLPWDNCLIIAAVMSAPPPITYLFINSACHLRRNRKPAGLHKHRVVPLSIKGKIGTWLGGGARRSLCSDYTGRITGMDDWMIYRRMGAGSHSYSSNKRILLLYWLEKLCCIDRIRNKAANITFIYIFTFHAPREAAYLAYCIWFRVG